MIFLNPGKNSDTLVSNGGTFYLASNRWPSLTDTPENIAAITATLRSEQRQCTQARLADEGAIAQHFFRCRCVASLARPDKAPPATPAPQ